MNQLQRAVKICEQINGQLYELTVEDYPAYLSASSTGDTLSIELVEISLFYDEFDGDEQLTVECVRERLIAYAQSLLRVLQPQPVAIALDDDDDGSFYGS